jgi:hypothetical protein
MLSGTREKDTSKERSSSQRKARSGDDPAAARATAERIWDRTPGTEPAVQMANQ